MAVEAKDTVLEEVPKGFGHVKRKAQEVSNAVEASEAAGGAKDAIISHWEWVKKGVEGRGK